MPGKHDRPRTRRRAALGLRAVRSPGADLARLRGPFLAWVTDHGLPTHVDGAALWADVVETGRWHGTPDELDAVLQAAEEATSPMAAVVAELATVSVDPAVERAALGALPLVQQAETLLRFVHPRRPVTGTGALRRADVVTVAGQLGLDLGSRTPRSMWDVPRLASLWQAAQDADLLDVTPTGATLTELAQGWSSGDVEQGDEARTRFVTAHLALVLTAPPMAPWLPPPLAMLLPVLAAAALDRPVPTERLVDPVGALDGVAGVPGDVALFAELAAAPAHTLVHQLADDGILDVSDTVDANPGLRGLLARLVGGLLATVEAPGGAGPELPPPDPALAGQSYRSSTRTCRSTSCTTSSSGCSRGRTTTSTSSSPLLPGTGSCGTPPWTRRATGRCPGTARRTRRRCVSVS
jgi:hypothetical protein